MSCMMKKGWVEPANLGISSKLKSYKYSLANADNSATYITTQPHDWMMMWVLKPIGFIFVLQNGSLYINIEFLTEYMNQVGVNIYVWTTI